MSYARKGGLGGRWRCGAQGCCSPSSASALVWVRFLFFAAPFDAQTYLSSLNLRDILTRTRLFSHAEAECVLGVVGRPVSLPCFYPQLLTVGNFTIEWRKDDKVILRSVFEKSQNTLELSADRSSLSSNATVTGDFSLEVPTVEPAQPRMNYGLFIIPEVNHSDALCRVCVRVAGQCTQNLTQTNAALAVNIRYHVLFVLRDRHHVMFKS